MGAPRIQSPLKSAPLACSALLSHHQKAMLRERSRAQAVHHPCAATSQPHSAHVHSVNTQEGQFGVSNLYSTHLKHNYRSFKNRKKNTKATESNHSSSDTLAAKHPRDPSQQTGFPGQTARASPARSLSTFVISEVKKKKCGKCLLFFFFLLNLTSRYFDPSFRENVMWSARLNEKNTTNPKGEELQIQMHAVLQQMKAKALL